MIKQIILPERRFIGREQELAIILQIYEAVKSGLVKAIFLTGDLGIGKTRLLEKFITYAASDGATIMRGDASASEGMPPYLPFLKALGEYVRIAPVEELRHHLYCSSDILESILPELTARLGKNPEPSPQLPEQVRLRLYEAIGTFLESVSASCALVFTLDDLPGIDRASLDLLCYIVQHYTRARLLILGAYRTGEVEDNSFLERTVTELARQRVLTTINIPRLTCAETETLAENYLHAPISPLVGRLLYTQSEGNPFFAEELLLSWIEMKALVLEHDRWVAVAPLEQTLPPNIVGALRQRFTRFSSETINHLRVAAIIGRTFRLSLLAQIEEQDAESIEEHLMEAVRARLIYSTQPDLFTFSHDKIREILYTEVSTSRRQRLHEKIGHALELLYNQAAARTIRQLAELAFHFSRSRDTLHGAAYSRQAAQQALLASAPGEALRYYCMALDQLEADNQQREEVLLELGQAAILAGAREKLDAFFDAVSVDVLPRGGITMSLAAQAILMGEKRWAEQLYCELLAFRGQHYWFLVDRFLGGLALLYGDVETALLHLSAAEKAAQREGLQAELAYILLDKSRCEQLSQKDGYQDRAGAYLYDALRLFEDLNMPHAIKRVRRQQQELMAQKDPAAIAQPPLPASLTEREVRVLRLVAAGMSNRQIAEELHLSEKTVANHLTHIFNKILCENRAAAAAFAIRNGLV